MKSLKKLNLYFLLIALSSMFSVQALSADLKGFGEFPKYDDKKEGYLLTNGTLNALIPDTMAKVQVIEVKDLAKDHIVVIFLASVDGTSVMINRYDGAIFNTKTKKHVGIFAHHRTSSSSGTKKSDLFQPKWTLSGSSLSIKDENEKEITIQLK